MIEGRVIVAIEKSGTLAGADEVIDLSNRLLVPGLVESLRTGCTTLVDDLALSVVTHVQETRLQVVTGQIFYGCPMVEYLDRIRSLPGFPQRQALVPGRQMVVRSRTARTPHGDNT